MKHISRLNKQIFKPLRKRRIGRIIDKLTFGKIMLIWISTIFFFGLAYFFLSGSMSYLSYSKSELEITNVWDAIYFSFVTATTTGFGDIIPLGNFRIVAIFEVVFGLLLLALVTSRLVSIKQDVLLSEIYDLSFNEKINSIRSSLLLFRQNIERTIAKTDQETYSKKDVDDIYIYLSSLKDILNEIWDIFYKQNENRYIKKIDPVNTELILNSLLSSFEKLHELNLHLNKKKIVWKDEATMMITRNCLSLFDNIFSTIKSYKISDKALKDLKKREKGIIRILKEDFKKKDES
ncbi:MAG: potassium channel family protein [Candidatus Woesearchaeota archaeon]